MGGTAAEATAAPMGVMAGALAEGKDELKKGAPNRGRCRMDRREPNNAFKKCLSLSVIMAKKTVLNFAKEKGIYRHRCKVNG